MKKIFIIALMITMTSSLVGCINSNNDDKNINSDNEITETIDSESNDKLYEQYEELAPKIQKILEDNGMEVEFETDESVRNYDKYTRIKVTGPAKPGNYSRIIFNLYIKNDGNPAHIGLEMNEYIDKNIIDNYGYKFEDTLNYKIAQVLLGNNLDYTNINLQITELLGQEETQTIEIEHGDIEEEFYVDSDFIQYLITINP